MTINIKFPDPIEVPRELPLYAAIAPSWDAKKVVALAERLDMHGDVTDAGYWFVCRNDAWTLEVYQASQSLRLEHNRFDFEGRDNPAGIPDRDHAVLIAQRFLGQIGGTSAKADVASVTELAVSKATRDLPDGERRVVGLQVNYRYTLDGLALVGPGAKAQVTVGHDGQLAQAYRFARDVKRVGERASFPPEEAFHRFAATERFANLRAGAKVAVSSVQLGLLSLPPTETQGVLLPAYVLRGEVSTEMLPRYEFISYVAAVEINEADAKRHRWQQVRPALLEA